MKTNENAWDQTNAAGVTLTPGANAYQKQNGPQPDGF
jgi:hypothetical protein